MCNFIHFGLKNRVNKFMCNCIYLHIYTCLLRLTFNVNAEDHHKNFGVNIQPFRRNIRHLIIFKEDETRIVSETDYEKKSAPVREQFYEEGVYPPPFGRGIFFWVGDLTFLFLGGGVILI